MGGRAVVAKPIAILLAFVALGIGAETAHATSSRADYVAQADPICKSSDSQLAQRLPGLIKRISKRQNITATIAEGYGLALGGKIFGQVTNQLTAIPPAPGDEATVSSWLDGRRAYKRGVDRAAAAGKHNKKKQMLRLLKQAIIAVSRANQLVVGFGFQYCVVPAE
jgi:hypothetical protein